MSKSEARGSLHVTAPGADIQVLDAYLRPVPDAKGVGAVQVTLPPGAYTVVSGLEGTSVSHDLLVRPGSSNDVSLEVPLAPAAPVSRFPTANETHGELAHELSRPRPRCALMSHANGRSTTNRRSVASAPAASNASSQSSISATSTSFSNSSPKRRTIASGSRTRLPSPMTPK